MATITSLGVGSGLDATAIIDSLMAVERRPLNLMQTEQSDMKTQLSSIGKLQSYMSALRDKSQALTSPTLWGQSKATSSDATAVNVSTSSGAAAGSYAVNVTTLATMQTTSSRAFASSSTTLNEGSLTLELGSWTGDPPTAFATKAGGSPVTISIGAGETSLATIRDKINAAGAGVTASIINDASGSRLALRSKETGAENAFRITASETSDDGDPTTGLSALAYDPPGGSAQMTRSQAAGNAAATINGIAISSASNTLEGVSDGMTIQLLKATTSAVDVNVEPDQDSVKTAVTDFVSAFNDLAGYIREQTKYDEAAKKGGVLQGDRTVVGMQWALRNVLNESTTASGTFGRLSDVGIVMKSDGTLETQSSKLEAGLANLPELKKLFATDGASDADSGFMQRFKEYADQTLDSDGAFETRNSSLNERLARNQDQQDAMQTRLEQTEKRLTAQYQALDATMAKLNSLSSYVTQQMASLNQNY